jgi:hypothetical protein
MATTSTLSASSPASSARTSSSASRSSLATASKWVRAALNSSIRFALVIMHLSVGHGSAVLGVPDVGRGRGGQGFGVGGGYTPESIRRRGNKKGPEGVRHSYSNTYLRCRAPLQPNSTGPRHALLHMRMGLSLFKL